jgi:sugar phosphate permease
MVPSPPKKQKRIFGLERNIFFIGLTSFLTDTTTKMIYSVMPLFLMSLGATKTELSLIEGIAESTASVLKALSGWWSDKIRKNKPFMLVGYLFTAILSPLFAFAASPFQVLGIRFAERVGKGIRTAPRDSLIAASTEEGGRGKGFGFHKAMDNSGAILGPLLAAGVLLLFPGDYRKVFIFAGIPAAFGVVSILAFVKERSQTEAHKLGKIQLKDFRVAITRFWGLCSYSPLEIQRMPSFWSKRAIWVCGRRGSLCSIWSLTVSRYSFQYRPGCSRTGLAENV